MGRYVEIRAAKRQGALVQIPEFHNGFFNLLTAIEGKHGFKILPTASAQNPLDDVRRIPIPVNTAEIGVPK